MDGWVSHTWVDCRRQSASDSRTPRTVQYTACKPARIEWCQGGVGLITVPIKVLGFVGYQNKNTNFLKKYPRCASSASTIASSSSASGAGVNDPCRRESGTPSDYNPHSAPDAHGHSVRASMAHGACGGDVGAENQVRNGFGGGFNVISRWPHPKPPTPPDLLRRRPLAPVLLQASVEKPCAGVPDRHVAIVVHRGSCVALAPCTLGSRSRRTARLHK